MIDLDARANTFTVASIAAWHRKQESDNRRSAEMCMHWYALGHEDSFYEIDCYRQRAENHGRIAEVLEAMAT